MSLVQKEEISHELVFGRSGVCGVGPFCTCLAAAKPEFYPLKHWITSPNWSLHRHLVVHSLSSKRYCRSHWSFEFDKFTVHYNCLPLRSMTEFVWERSLLLRSELVTFHWDLKWAL
jgi:hypothetical protein